MSHTPEPWEIGHYQKSGYDIWLGNNLEHEKINRRAGKVNLRTIANATRIVSCINGCAGLNPAAYREVINNLKAVIYTLEQPNAHISHLSLESLKHALTSAEQTP